MTTPNNFAFTPATGLRDASAYPTVPASEADLRSAIQTPSDQLRDYINETLIPNLGDKVNTIIPELHIPLWIYDVGAFTVNITTSGSNFLVKGETGPSTTVFPLHTLSSKWPTTTKFALEVAIHTNVDGYAANAALWDTTANAIVAGTQTTSTISGSDSKIVRSTSVSLTPGRSYGVTVWTQSGASALISEAYLIALP